MLISTRTFDLWLRCKQAYDEFDRISRIERGIFHGDICMCSDCEAVRIYDDLPPYKRFFVTLFLGSPKDKRWVQLPAPGCPEDGEK